MACGTSQPAPRAPTLAKTPSPPPLPSVSVDRSSLSAEVYGGRSTATSTPVGYDDHWDFVIVNTGRDIEDLFIDLSGGDRWLDHHGIAMGSTPQCDIEASAEGVACGALPSGRELAVILRATPTTPGTLHYSARFFDRTATGMHEIRRRDGGSLVISLAETVTPRADAP